MARYRTNELEFDLPEALEDKTHHIFSLPGEGPSAFSLVISHSPVAPEENIQSYGERLVAELQRSLPQFSLLNQRPGMIGDHPCWAIDYRWKNQGQWLHQRQANIFYSSDSGKPMVLQMTTTVTGEFTEQWSEMFLDILQSLQFRSPDAAPKDSPSRPESTAER
jgi:hypothetical protein